jgi:mRNA degradation ribonuclease J1/J2
MSKTLNQIIIFFLHQKTINPPPFKSNGRSLRRKGKKMIKKKQRFYKQAKKHNKWTNYRAYQKECKRHLRKAVSDYINKNIIERLENNSTQSLTT